MITEHECVESALLMDVSESDIMSDEFAVKHGVESIVVIGLINSLSSANIVSYVTHDNSRCVLTNEADVYITNGSPEAQAFHAVPPEGCTLVAFKGKVDNNISDVGFKQAMQCKWIGMVKGNEPMVERKVTSIIDTTRRFLEAVKAGEEIPLKELDNLIKRRKLVRRDTWKTYKVTKGELFTLKRKKVQSDLTKEMMMDGSWRTSEFKVYNLIPGAGAVQTSGHLHPLLKVREQFRNTFLQLGFAEMPTNNFIESGFWNFDALIQPQMHPARDAHDTFFLKTPAKANRAPEAYVDKVKTMHQVGGYGSIGHKYAWKRLEADRNILRTHTTAVSARCLYQLAKDGFKPAKYFSIDRVFRNEALDRTHLAEFHQVEGVICDKNLTLGDLIGVLHQFFARLGMTKLRFKPAFNPYTEPSMEIFAFHPLLKKWMEVGNSGMFRPEMLNPMGLPEDVNVIAWGLSLERPTMIMYGINNIRDLFGSKIQMSTVKNIPICRLGMIEQPETVKMYN